MSRKCLWIYGWGMSTQIWSEVIEDLPDYEHHLVHFGECLNIEDFYLAIEKKLLDSPGEWTLIGWSMGGMLALESVFEQKKREKFNIKSLIVISSTLKFTNQDRTKGWSERIVKRMKKQLLIDPEETILQFKKLVFQSFEATAQTSQLLYSEKTEFSLNGLEAGLNYLMNTDLTSNWIEFNNDESEFPLLWIHGQKDPICPSGFPDELVSDRTLLIGNGHVPFLYDKKQFIYQVNQFLNE
ncbi:serine aminopeptidase domain-containing protein [Chengkuizengella axinellae]|uniref:Alpha/beta hydrolase n=1 Tax=Chengkuizengella axinellae TaxID=3064388 RepID=A0ABT9J013_9BACL|nr:alpha/beta hydrolase [Chengkuizengella sp. 2205SS18-9]MDP5274958.1 alpha/beta hydrolase [Chengkuizengella sp. 2205SS18-9]